MRNIESKSGFYILWFEDGFKFGITKNIEERMRSYKKPWGKELKDEFYYYCDREIAKQYELLMIQKAKTANLTANNSLEYVIKEYSEERYINLSGQVTRDLDKLVEKEQIRQEKIKELKRNKILSEIKVLQDALEEL